MNVTVICDRCKKEVSGIRDPKFTGGFYDVSSGHWAGYANEGEKNVCDACMHNDPRYQKDYGQLPRRILMNRMTPAELAISKITRDVDSLGAHPLLTDAVVLLSQAREKLADWVDMQLSAQAEGAPDDTRTN